MRARLDAPNVGFCCPGPLSQRGATARGSAGQKLKQSGLAADSIPGARQIFEVPGCRGRNIIVPGEEVRTGVVDR